MKRNLPAYVYAKGKRGYLYFCRNGVTQRMKEAPGTPEFALEYAKAMQGRVIVPAKNMKRLIAHYMASPKWAKLADKTRRNYEGHFRYFLRAMENVDPTTLRRVHINQMRDAFADKPTDANHKISAISVLMNHAVDIGWMERNPAHGVSRLPGTGKHREAWPEEMIEAFRAAAPPRALLIFELLIGTGQRIRDVLGLQWGQIDGDGFTIRQHKTGTELYIPLTDRLRSVLAQTPRKGLFIVCQANGRPLTYATAWVDVREVRRTIGADKYDIHGLRHTAASEIASIPGMTADHVKAITGHQNGAMVRLYAGKAMQKARAKEAQRAREHTEPKA